MRTWNRIAYRWTRPTDNDGCRRDGLPTNESTPGTWTKCWLLESISASCQEDGAGILEFYFYFGQRNQEPLSEAEIKQTQRNLLAKVILAASRAASGAKPKSRALMVNDEPSNLTVAFRFYPKDSILGGFTEIVMGVISNVLDDLGIPREHIGRGTSEYCQLVWQEDRWVDMLEFAEAACGITKKAIGSNFCDGQMFE